ncbi:hypothetical protein [Runella sp.]|uniref:hypothetical protein n=1 Tax=Runella sp. TaxID=1960881 RepID=UPI003D0A3708
MKNKHWRNHPKLIIDESGEDYYLFEEIQGNPDSFTIRKVSTEEVKKVRKANEDLFEFLFLFRKIKELDRNHNEALTKIFQLKNFWAIKNNPLVMPEDEIEDAFIEVNRKFTNFILSFANFHDIFKKRVINRYTKKSSEYQKFINFIATSKEKHFVYRFFGELRNYTAHFHYPINYINPSVYFDEKSDDYVGEIPIYFDKNKLLEDKDIREKLGADLQNLKDLFDVEPYLIDIIPVLEKLNQFLFNIIKNDLIESSNILMRLYNECSNLGNSVFIGNPQVVKHVNGRYIIETPTIRIRTDIIEDIRKAIEKYTTVNNS